MLNIAMQNEFTGAVKQSYLSHLLEKMQARSLQYIKAQEYYDGIQQTQLTDRVKAFLDLNSDVDIEFNVNYCPMVVDAMAHRLKVTGFAIADNDDTSAIINQWWRKNRMDGKQNIVHHNSIKNGDSYVLVEWDENASIPRFHHEPAYTGEGVMVYYSEERRDEIEFASKSWRIERGVNAGKMRRLNLYFADRIEKYISHDDNAQGDYFPFDDINDTTQVFIPGYLGPTAVSWWTDTGFENGTPLGVPVFHFKHNDTGDSFGTSKLWNVIPVQDALNKSMIDLLATMDAEAFGILVGHGGGWGNVKVAPGTVLNSNKPKSESEMYRLPGTSPTGLLAVYEAFVNEIARISSTPLSYIQAGGQVAAEGTLKQQETALVTQVQKAQTDYGNVWEDVLAMGIRLHNAFGESGTEIDSDVIIDTIWQDAESRNDKELAETLQIKVTTLGVSEEQAQIEMDYTPEQRKSFRKANSTRIGRDTINNVLSQSRASPNGANGAIIDDDSASENLTQTENEAVV